MTHCRLSERPGGSQTRRKRSAPLTFLNGERPGVVGRSNVPKWERGRGGGGHVGSNCRRRSTIEHLLTRLQSLFCFFIAWFHFPSSWWFTILQTKSYDDLEPPRIEDSNQKKNNVDHGFLNGFVLGHSWLLNSPNKITRLRHKHTCPVGQRIAVPRNNLFLLI